MGLDISAWSNLTFVAPLEDREDDYVLHRIYASGGEEFRTRMDGLAEGWYEEGEGCKGIGFRAGSYSGYNRWREELARAALATPPERIWNDFAKFKGKPFVELIHFSDAEGAIGPKTAKKLAKDFAAHREKVEGGVAAILADDDELKWWMKTYDNWQKAFELAAQNGFVKFH